MDFKFGLTIAVLLAFVAKGHSQLQCYVCDNCAKIDKNTPIEACGGGAASTTTVMTPSGTYTMSTMTDMSTSEATTTTTGNPTTTTTGHPTPATAGPISSTTGLPTPPSAVPVEVNSMDIYLTPSVNSTSNLTLSTPPTLFVTPTVVIPTTTDQPIIVLPTSNSTLNATGTSTLLVRQRRNIPMNGMTYHCYSVQKKYDNVYGVQRGCMGVETQQSVCVELNHANSNQTRKCKPCSTDKCNGSSTIGVSIATVLVALVAVIYRF